MQASLAYVAIVLAGALLGATQNVKTLVVALFIFFFFVCVLSLLVGFETFVLGFEYTMMLAGAYCFGQALRFLTEGALRRLRP